MSRCRRWSVLAALAALLTPPARAGEKPAEVTWVLDRALTVSPAPEPVPALKYRLFPLASERKEGNAVPIYLRLSHEQSDAARKLWREEPEKWNKLSLDQIPRKEANEFLQQFRHFYQQFDLGARRKTAEWNYTLDQGSIIDIRLPDAQAMRTFVPMLVLRARVEAAEGNYPAAVRSLETGFSFSQQAGAGPFLISTLIGIACATQFTDAVADLVERPGAPNLYWALTVIPRPLVDHRPAIDLEQRIVEMQFPDLADLDRPRTAGQWDALLARVRKDLQRMNEASRLEIPPLPGRAPDDPADRSPDLPVAKQYLTGHAGMKADEVDAMPPSRVLLLWMVHYAREHFDDHFKAAYLPYRQARAVALAADRRTKVALASTPFPHSEAARLVQSLLPVTIKVQGALARLDRRFALLRVVEALRMYAAANGGALPDRLDQVTEAPVPDDPGTGKPFEYARDGATATLTSRIPDEPPTISGLRYKVTIRK
jgi:hypothetical protein